MKVEEILIIIKDACINKWHQFSEWIHLKKWVNIFTIFFGFIKKFFVILFHFFYRLFKGFLTLLKSIKEIIRMIIFPVTIITIIVIMIIASVNYFSTNQQIQTNIDNFIKTIDCVESVTVSNINDLKKEMQMLSVKVFNSNTITFLVSFFLILLGGLLFNNTNKVSDLIKSVEISIKQLETERATMTLISNILALRSIIIVFQNSLEMNKDDNSITIINFKTVRIIKTITNDIYDGKYLCITKDGKKILKEILQEMINDFGIGEDEEIDFLPNDSLKRKYLKYIDLTIKGLEQLNSAISIRLREI